MRRCGTAGRQRGDRGAQGCNSAVGCNLPSVARTAFWNVDEQRFAFSSRVRESDRRDEKREKYFKRQRDVGPAITSACVCQHADGERAERAAGGERERFAQRRIGAAISARANPSVVKSCATMLASSPAAFAASAVIGPMQAMILPWAARTASSSCATKLLTIPALVNVSTSLFATRSAKSATLFCTAR